MIIHKSKIIELSNILELNNLSNEEKVKAILKNTGHIIFESSLKSNDDINYESDEEKDVTQNNFSYRKDSVRYNASISGLYIQNIDKNDPEILAFINEYIEISRNDSKDMIRILKLKLRVILGTLQIIDGYDGTKIKCQGLKRAILMNLKKNYMIQIIRALVLIIILEPLNYF